MNKEGRLSGRRRMVLWAAAIMFLSSIVASGSYGPTHAAATAEPIATASKAVKVSWDFGSGPGKTSNFYVGEKAIQPGYDTPECSSRFTLESVRYDMPRTPSGELGPPFVMFTFRKHFAGDFDRLPAITITQVTSAANKPRETAEVTFPFREKQMAAPVKDWTLPDIDVQIGAPGEIMDLHNPFGWAAIEVSCK